MTPLFADKSPMVKQCVLNWKPVCCKVKNGILANVNLPNVIESHYNGNLLINILTMPKKIPISFNSAIQLIVDKKRLAFEAGQVGRKPGHYLWYIENFVSCISSMGYHIELTGDEFETYNLTEHLS